MIKNRRGPLPDLLDERRITPGQLARKVGVQPRAIHRLIEGVTGSLPRERARAIAAELGVELQELTRLIEVQRDIRGLVRFNEDLANLNGAVTFWRSPTSPEAIRWAPRLDVAESVLQGLRGLVDRNFDLPSTVEPTEPESVAVVEADEDEDAQWFDQDEYGRVDEDDEDIDDDE